MQGTFVYHVHPAAQEILQGMDQGNAVQKRTSLFHADEQIHIACLVSFPAHHGPEDADVAGAMCRSQTQDLIATLSQIIERRHMWYSPHVP
jgi:hypothetical protein